jgi:hypothetical protein
VRYGSLNVGEILRVTITFPESLKLITHIHFFLQACCGSAEVLEFSEEIVSTYPECHPESIHGKIQTAGYTVCL